VILDPKHKETTMYSHVIVGVDGRAGGLDAAALAASLTTAAADMSLVHVCVIDPVPNRGSSAAFELADAERAIALLENERRHAGPDADTVRVAATSVGEGLAEVARERHADLTVVGGSHRHFVGRVLVGDNAASVLHHAPCAVAIAPAGYANQPQAMEKIGLAYDDTPEGRVALSHARRLAASLGRRVIGRHVVTPHVYGNLGYAGAYVDEAEDLLAVTRERLGQLDGVDLEAAVGPTGPELAAFSEDVDLIVCGSQQNGALRRIALGSTSDYLARHARCPLLVTPTTDATTTTVPSHHDAASV
jgi:nucleotide-binding universal stress UspA family protein